MCDEGRFTYHDLREQRLAVATVEGLPGGLGPRDRRPPPSASASHLKDAVAGRRRAVSALHSNEDNFALAQAREGVEVGDRVHRGQAARAGARRWPAARRRHQSEHRRASRRSPRRSASMRCPPSARHAARRRRCARWSCSATCSPGVDTGKLKELEVISIAAHERGPVAAREGRAARRGVGRDGRHDRPTSRASCSACTPPSRRRARRSRLGSGRSARARNRREARVDASARGVQRHDRGGSCVEGADVGA